MLEIEPRAGDLAERPTKARDDLAGRSGTFGQRLQRDEDEVGVGLAAAGEDDNVLDIRIAADDTEKGCELLLHALEGDGLVGLDAADQDARILGRKKAFRDCDEEEEREADGRRECHHGND